MQAIKACLASIGCCPGGQIQYYFPGTLSYSSSDYIQLAVTSLLAAGIPMRGNSSKIIDY